MDWLEFTASMTGSLAWPVSAAVIALIFRGQIKAVFSRLEELGFGDWKIKLGKDLDQAESVAQQLPPPPEPEPQQIEAPKLDSAERFQQLVRVSPNAAILDAWLEIEIRLREIARNVGPGAVRHLPQSELIRVVSSHPLFPTSLVRLLREMAEIRNLASHTSSVSIDDAYRFKKLADQVMPFLRLSQLDQR